MIGARREAGEQNPAYSPRATSGDLSRDVDRVTHLSGDAEVGEFVNARIVRVRGFDFIGEVVP